MRYILIILALSFLLFSCRNKKSIATAESDVYYTCSMDPQVKANKRGKCPVCKMELTPVKKSSRQQINEIELSAQQIQLGNIRIDTLRNGTTGDQMILPATISLNRQKQNAVSARVMGRIEKLYFKNLGDYVDKGSKLFDLYSEELNNAKQEYLLVLEKQRTLDNTIIDFKQLVQAAKNKLILWGMREAQIQELIKNGKATTITSIYSPSGGYITSLDAKEGEYVTEGGTVVRLADLSTLWAEAQAYSSQLSSIDKGGLAIVQFPGTGNKEVQGRIEFINPEINPDTRIDLVRITIPNNGNQIKPGMQANVVIRNRQHNSLSLPIDAVIRDNRGASVWLQSTGNKFTNKMVEVGPESNGRIEIKSGLRNGDAVVVSGAYLLNSEYIFKIGANPMEGMKM